MRDREPVEIVLIAVPVLCEAIAVCLFIAAAAVWLIVIADRVRV
jgi:hypothetical protein